MKVILYLLLLMPIAAHACIRGPVYSEHKSLHFLGLAGATSTVSSITNNDNYGYTFALVLGAAREIQKMYTGGDCEVSSIAYDLLGTLIGPYTKDHLQIELRPRGAFITAVMKF